MSETAGTWKTVASPAQGLYKEKGSRFISYIYPVQDENEIKSILSAIKKEHHSARHHCYAWRLGVAPVRFRANDDGEPSSTAGKPILGQLVSHSLTNTLLVVVRYFGGTLLGVSGLITAYREAAADAIRQAKTETRISMSSVRLEFPYSCLNAVMTTIKNEDIQDALPELSESCIVRFSIPASETEGLRQLFSHIYGVKFFAE